jgi:hypothetical protein
MRSELSCAMGQMFNTTVLSKIQEAMAMFSRLENLLLTCARPEVIRAEYPGMFIQSHTNFNNIQEDYYFFWPGSGLGGGDIKT